MEKYSFLNDIPPTPGLSDRDVLVIGKFTVIDEKIRFIGHTVSAADLKKELIAGAVEDANLDYYVEQARIHADSAEVNSSSASKDATISTEQAEIATAAAESIKDNEANTSAAIDTLHTQLALTQSEVASLDNEKLGRHEKAESAKKADSAGYAGYIMSGPTVVHPNTIAMASNIGFPYVNNLGVFAATTSSMRLDWATGNLMGVGIAYIRVSVFCASNQQYARVLISFNVDSNEDFVNPRILIEQQTATFPSFFGKFGQDVNGRQPRTIALFFSNALTEALITVTDVRVQNPTSRIITMLRVKAEPVSAWFGNPPEITPATIS